MFRHKLLYLNFTTYDVRQDQDVVNPSTDRRDIMFVRAPSPGDKAAEDHRHIYGRVLGIYHANIMLSGSNENCDRWDRFDFLWVRWFRPIKAERTWTSKRLDVLTFPPLHEHDSLSFVDPGDILRACHITPRFSRGLAAPTEGLSVCVQNSKDWNEYLVNRSVQINFS